MQQTEDLASYPFEWFRRLLVRYGTVRLIAVCVKRLFSPPSSQKIYPLEWAHVTLITQVNENPSFFYQGKIILEKSCLPRVV